MLAAMALTNQMTTQLANKKTVRTIDRLEAFYAGELAAWHAYLRKESGLEIKATATPVAFDNGYLNQLTDAESDYSSSPVL